MSELPLDGWCGCQHSRWFHFAGHLTKRGGRLTRVTNADEPYRCHYSFCTCKYFTHDTSLWSRIKRKINIK